MDDIARSVLAAQGITDGDEWVQPTDATNAYPKDWTVTHDGKTWVSLTPANVWEPGVSGWREVVEEGSGAPEWVQPTDATNAYPKDWTVTHDGKTWVSLTPANVWPPGVSGWREIVDESAGAPEWVQPTGAHDAYQTGDRVMFEGAEYKSLIDGNTWSPTAYPQGWEKINA